MWHAISNESRSNHPEVTSARETEVTSPAGVRRTQVREDVLCRGKGTEPQRIVRGQLVRSLQVGRLHRTCGTQTRTGFRDQGHVDLAGGRWIVLSPEGFGERWHPGREYEKFCAEGRMLFLSLWPAMGREPTKKELFDRCHEMGDLVAEGLKGI